jgi:hypothetical protein
MRNPTRQSIVRITSLCSFLLLMNGCQKSTTTTNSVAPPPVNNEPPPAPAKKWTVTTLAGSGNIGAADGTGVNAQFNYPQDLAIDKQGNIYVGDSHNFSIRKIDTSGQVSTYTSQSIGNPSLAFGNIYGIVPDDQGNLFTVEYSLIRKITSATNSFLFAGSLQVTYKDGQDTSARFRVIGNIAIDQTGNLFLPDFDANYKFQVRKVTPSGLVSSLSLVDHSGYPSNGDSSYYYLSAICVDAQNNIYVSGNGNGLVRKIDAQGNVTLFAGQGSLGLTDGKGANAQFNNIGGLAADPGGNIWVADAGNNAIRKITPDGTVSTIAGLGSPGFSDGDSSTAKFNDPVGITVGKNGIVYISDFQNQRIRKIEYK